MKKQLEKLLNQFESFQWNRSQRNYLMNLKNSLIDEHDQRLTKAYEDAYNKGWNRALDYVNKDKFRLI